MSSLRKNRKGTASKFGAACEVTLVLPQPYLRTPVKPLNSLGIPERPHYRTSDVCHILGIKPELFRYRLYKRQYPEFQRDGKGRLFSIEDLRILIELSKHLEKRQAK